MLEGRLRRNLLRPRRPVGASGWTSRALAHQVAVLTDNDLMVSNFHSLIGKQIMVYGQDLEVTRDLYERLRTEWVPDVIHKRSRDVVIAGA